MRYMRYFILGLISLGLIVVSLANREMVTLNLLPEALGDLFSVTLKFMFRFLFLFCQVLLQVY